MKWATKKFGSDSDGNGGIARMGVDCSGFVSNVIENSSQNEKLGSTALSGTDIQEKCDKGDLAENPSKWRAMDVIRWGGSGPNGHIVIVHSRSELNEDGEYTIEVMHSSGSKGPTGGQVVVDENGTLVKSNVDMDEVYVVSRPKLEDATEGMAQAEDNS